MYNARSLFVRRRWSLCLRRTGAQELRTYYYSCASLTVSSQLKSTSPDKIDLRFSVRSALLLLLLLLLLLSPLKLLLPTLLASLLADDAGGRGI